VEAVVRACYTRGAGKSRRGASKPRAGTVRQAAALCNGPEYLKVLRQGVADWMLEFEWESLESMRGNMSLAHCPDPAVYERPNYMMMLQGWRSR
jgi:hypothetical protein